MRDLLLVTGDSSSDRYAARLVSYLYEKDYQGTVHAAAGHATEQAGARLVENVVDRGVVGLTEVVGSLPFFFSLMGTLDDVMREHPIGAVLVMDFPGFNMRLAKRAHRKGLPVYYYITPQVWAWGRWRLPRLREWFQELFVIFPFEETFFREREIPARFVGHPLLEAWPEAPSHDLHEVLKLPEDTRIVSFFPGSRDHEIERHLEPMAEAALRVKRSTSNVVPVFSAAPTVDQQKIQSILGDEGTEQLPVWGGDSHSLLTVSEFCVATSGTITMEATFAETPMIVGYRASWLTYLVGRFLAGTDRVAMPNHIDPDVDVPELIQSDFTVDHLEEQVREYLENDALRRQQRDRLREVRSVFARRRPSEEVGARLLGVLRHPESVLSS